MSEPRPPLGERLRGLSAVRRKLLFDRLSPEEMKEIEHDWSAWGRADQQPPGGDWRVWLMMAGRGFGKTRAGAEWVRGLAERDGSLRIALVAATMAEARAVMVEGESGLLAVAGPAQFHLAVLTGAGFVHAHAGLRRVVETPGAPAWPVLGAWRATRGN